MAVAILLPYGLFLRAAMFAYDIASPNMVSKDDRTAERLANIDGLAAIASQSGDLIGYLASHGIVGDYSLHALAYVPLGQYGVIVV